MAQFDPASNSPDLISVDDAVRQYGISRSTLFRAIADGKLTKFKKVGVRRTLISERELVALLEPEAQTRAEER